MFEAILTFACLIRKLTLFFLSFVFLFLVSLQVPVAQVFFFFFFFRVEST